MAAPQVRFDRQPADKTADISNIAAVKASRMATLLGIEAGAREAETITALAIKSVNDPRSLTGFQQAFCLEKSPMGAYKVIAVTSQNTINRHAPLIQMIEACAQKISLEQNPDEPFSFDIQKLQTLWSKEQASYPFRHFYWMPIIAASANAPAQQLGGFLLARQTPWRDVDIIVLKRIIDTYAHAWGALKWQRKARPVRRNRKKLLATAGTIVFALAMFIPVPYTAVAPAQIIADDPWIVSAPVDGVIDKIYVNPNGQVSSGDPLFSFVDTTLRNSATIAENELLLADARFENIKRSALISSEGRREITVASAEKALAATREKYARELLANVHIRAPRDGVVLFSNKNDLTGKPVVTGQKIMEIADPARVAIAIEVPPGDGLAMQIGQRVSVYLDVDPLTPVRGVLVRASFTPAKTEAGRLAYHGVVMLDPQTRTIPRIGLRGSAKLKAGNTALGYWLFRKPIVVARRSFGI